MSLYPAIHMLHVTCVVISISFFCLRLFWMWTSHPLLNTPWVRVSPHIVDTILLTSAITLTMMLSQYPLQQNWLTVKLIALLVYIDLGMVALRRGRTRAIRGLAGVAAILTFCFIVSVAWFHHPLGLFVLLS